MTDTLAQICFKIYVPLQQKISPVFRVTETLLAAEEAKGVGGEKERMLTVRGCKAVLDGKFLPLPLCQCLQTPVLISSEYLSPPYPLC